MNNWKDAVLCVSHKQSSQFIGALIQDGDKFRKKDDKKLEWQQNQGTAEEDISLKMMKFVFV